MDSRWTLAGLAQEIDEGRLTSLALTRECLERIKSGERNGSRSLTQSHARAIDEASAFDGLRKCGIALSLRGIPISVKDLFDVAGEVTAAGSLVLADRPPAVTDAIVVRHLRTAGAIIVGRTNMTEFAYSALGLNPHYGTPRNPHDPSRIPGGSSSGAATSVAHGFCVASIGTDTAGSVRIPAAFCGLVGFKPTQGRLPRGGVFPLSRSLDSVGSIARTVSCCALLDGIMAGECRRYAPPVSIESLRLAVAERTWADGLDGTVARAFERTLQRLAKAGARVIRHDFTALSGLSDVERSGTIVGPEAFAVHRQRLAQSAEAYDPHVRSRLEDYGSTPAADYIDALRARSEAIERFREESAPFDAVLAPTVAVVAPRFDELERYDDYRRINALVRRNAALVNLFDGCALSIPCHESGELPVGLMVVGARNADARVLAVGTAIERVLSPGATRLRPSFRKYGRSVVMRTATPSVRRSSK